MKQTIKCIIACRTCMGESNLYFVKVDVEGKNQDSIDNKIDNDKHKTAAKRAAKENGMIGPFIVFDEYDESSALFQLFLFETASTVVVK